MGADQREPVHMAIGHEMHGLCMAGTLVFDRQAAEVAALRELTQGDLVHFLQVPPLSSWLLELGQVLGWFWI